MRFNVITPMVRIHNAPDLIKMLAPQKIQWHVVVDDDNPLKLVFDEDWINVYRCPNPETTFYARSNFSINWMFENHVDSEGYWCVLNDDDAYEPGFFDKLRKSLSDDEYKHDVVIVGMERGDATPSDASWEHAHGTHRLPAHPDHAKMNHVGVEQMIASGSVMKQYRIPYHLSGDGQWVEHIAQRHEVLYLDNLNVWFNYYEPGRWNSA